jgi:hypothetical protein
MSVESSDNASFSIVVMRSFSDARKDDQIHVKPEGQFYTLKYTNMDEQFKHKQALNTTEVFAYMRDFITLISADEKPFEQIQFNFPGVPSVVFSPESLRDYRIQDVILKRFDCLLANWPVRVSKSS